jgi:hypothetical protein
MRKLPPRAHVWLACARCCSRNRPRLTTHGLLRDSGGGLRGACLVVGFQLCLPPSLELLGSQRELRHHIPLPLRATLSALPQHDHMCRSRSIGALCHGSNRRVETSAPRRSDAHSGAPQARPRTARPRPRPGSAPGPPRRSLLQEKQESNLDSVSVETRFRSSARLFIRVAPRGGLPPHASRDGESRAQAQPLGRLVGPTPYHQHDGEHK